MYNLIYSSTAKEALKILKKNEMTSKTSQYNTKVQQAVALLPKRPNNDERQPEHIYSLNSKH